VQAARTVMVPGGFLMWGVPNFRTPRYGESQTKIFTAINSKIEKVFETKASCVLGIYSKSIHKPP
jgi:hypothetical protein